MVCLSFERGSCVFYEQVFEIQYINAGFVKQSIMAEISQNG